MKVQLLQKGIRLDKTDRKTVLAIALPSMVELVFSQLFAMVDTIMLGQYKYSAVAIAAVGLTNNPTNLIMGVLTAMNIGTSAAVAWAIGAKDSKGARDVTRMSLTMNFLMGTLAFALCSAFAGWIVSFMGAQTDTYEFAKTYMEIIAAGFIPATISFGVTSALRGAGKTRLPMVYNLIGNLLNVIGNYALIYGNLGMPELGVAGAAISTTISRYITYVLALATLYFVQSPVKLTLRGDYRIRMPILRRVTKVGITSAIEQLIMQIGFIMFARTVSGLGTAIFAAHQIGLSVNGIIWMPAQAFGVAATTLVGQSVGAGKPQKAREFARLIHRYSLCMAAVMALFLLTASQVVVRAYTNDTYVAEMAASVVRLLALGVVGLYTQMPIAAALRGAGDAKFPLIASAAGIWIFRVVVAPIFVYTLGWGLTGAWVTIAMDQITRAAVVYWRFLSGKWMRAKVVT